MKIQDVADYYNSKSSVDKYGKSIEQGLWASEEKVFAKYIRKNDNVLDLGCGAGRTTINLYRAGYKNIIGLDLAKSLVSYAKKYCKENNLDIKFLQGDATRLPFEENQFDVVIFSYNGWICIPEEENRKKALNEIHRVLKKGGLFIFTAQDRNNKRFEKSWLAEKQLWKDGQQNKALEMFGDKLLPDENGGLGFIHFYSLAEIREMCEDNGFKVLLNKNNVEIGSKDETSHETYFWVVEKLLEEQGAN